MTTFKLSFDIGDIEINICSFDTDTEMPIESQISNNHFHQYIECLYTDKGYFDISTKDCTHRINEGEICIIPKMLNHSTCGFSGNSSRTGFMFYMKHKKKGYPALYNKFSKIFSSDDIMKFKASGELVEYLKASHRLHKNITENETLKMTNLYSLIILSISEELEGIHTPPLLAGISTEENERTYYIENYIYDNYMNNISIKTLSKELHICERQINRILIANTGHTFSDILFQQRMISARELLNDPRVKAIDIPEKVGFKSYSGFYTSFKKFWGISPKEIKTIR